MIYSEEDLEQMSKTDVSEIAENLGIEVGKMKKADIIAEILEKQPKSKPKPAVVPAKPVATKPAPVSATPVLPNHPTFLELQKEVRELLETKGIRDPNTVQTCLNEVLAKHRISKEQWQKIRIERNN